MEINNIKLGEKQILGMTLGNKVISKAYLGEILIFENDTNINLEPHINDPGDITYDPIENLL